MNYRKPKRFFEDSGTVDPKQSYFVSLEHVTNTKNMDIKTMVDRGRYFSIFAPRQSGKTTFLARVRDQLHGDPTYVVILLSFQFCKNLDGERFYSEIEKELYRQLRRRLGDINCEKCEVVEEFLNRHHLNNHVDLMDLFDELNRIIQYKKIAVFIDEFDGIPENLLEDFLASLRELYLEYKEEKQKALYSVGLTGIRNITKLVVGGVSPFNIADQVTLPSFTLQNIRDLYGQYTRETNQPFTDEAIKKIHVQTAGQTWLVNRLGTILTINVKPGTTEPIDETDVEKAFQLLLNERNAHFDNLYEKAKLFKETFVEIVFDHVEYEVDDEDQAFLEQYGLIKNKEGHAVVANNIYKARYLKKFFKDAKADNEYSLQPYELPGNRLDIERVLVNFNLYIAQIGVKAFYAEAKPYEKTGQFLLTAWLYQFVKGVGNEVRDELLTGLGRLDIMLTHKGKKYIFETKVNRHKDIDGIIRQGVHQLSAMYLTTEQNSEGIVVVFDTLQPVGTPFQKQIHTEGDKQIMIAIIPIGEV